MAKFHEPNNLYPTPSASGKIYFVTKFSLLNNIRSVKYLIFKLDMGIEATNIGFVDRNLLIANKKTLVYPKP